MSTHRKGYLLPDNPAPVGYYCMHVYIPREVMYLRNFMGALDFFGKWLAYEETGAGNAKIAADTWKVANELTRAAYALSECDMPDFQINPTTCLLEVNCSTDPENPDWQPVFTPAYDPTEDAPPPELYPDPPPPGETNECLAAENVTAFMQNGIGNMVGNIAAGGGLGVLAGLIVNFVAVVVSALQANLWFMLLSVDWSQFNPATIQASYDAFNWDDFKNLIVCYFNPNGGMGAASHLEALAEMQAQTGEVWVLIRLIWSLIGHVGVGMAARWGDITAGNCATCGFEHLFTFADDGLFLPRYTLDSGTLESGQHVAGQWESVLGTSDVTSQYTDHLAVYRMFDERVITRAFWQGFKTHPQAGAGNIQLFYGGIWNDVATVTVNNGQPGECEFIGSQAATGISIQLNGFNAGGNCIIYDLMVEGEGSDPFV